MRTTRTTGTLLFVLCTVLSVPAEAYVGPGAALSVFAAAAALIGGVLLAIAGFLWYPMKRLWRAIAARRSESPQGAQSRADR